MEPYHGSSRRYLIKNSDLPFDFHETSRVKKKASKKASRKRQVGGVGEDVAILKLPDTYNTDYDLPSTSTFKEITFGNSFDSTFSVEVEAGGYIELQLKKLVFGMDFGRSVGTLDYLNPTTFKNLTELDLGFSFDKELSYLTTPSETARTPLSLPKLEKLYLPHHFNKKVIYCDFPELTTLTFGDKYNQDEFSGTDFTNVLFKFPKLTYVTFGNEFDKQVTFPSECKLTHLTLGRKFQSALDFGNCKELKHLSVHPDGGETSATLTFPDGHKVVTIAAGNFKLVVTSLPNLENLTYGNNPVSVETTLFGNDATGSLTFPKLNELTNVKFSDDGGNVSGNKVIKKLSLHPDSKTVTVDKKCQVTYQNVT